MRFAEPSKQIWLGSHIFKDPYGRQTCAGTMIAFLSATKVRFTEPSVKVWIRMHRFENPYRRESWARTVRVFLGTTVVRLTEPLGQIWLGSHIFKNPLWRQSSARAVGSWHFQVMLNINSTKIFLVGPFVLSRLDFQFPDLWCEKFCIIWKYFSRFMTYDIRRLFDCIYKRFWWKSIKKNTACVIK